MTMVEIEIRFVKFFILRRKGHTTYRNMLTFSDIDMDELTEVAICPSLIIRIRKARPDWSCVAVVLALLLEAQKRQQEIESSEESTTRSSGSETVVSSDDRSDEEDESSISDDEQDEICSRISGGSSGECSPTFTISDLRSM